MPSQPRVATKRPLGLAGNGCSGLPLVDRVGRQPASHGRSSEPMRGHLTVGIPTDSGPSLDVAIHRVVGQLSICVFRVVVNSERLLESNSI